MLVTEISSGIIVVKVVTIIGKVIEIYKGLRRKITNEKL